MKYHLTISLIVLLCLPVFADKFVVESFEEAPMDISAREHQVTDINDNPCALIKIRTDLTGLIFDSNRGIAKVEYKTSEYWVYLPAGTKILKISKTGFIKLNYEIPLPLKESTVYSMVLTNKGEVKGEEQELQTEFVVINSVPEGAEVYINDEYKGTTPFSSPMLEGKYTYELKKNMYHSDKGEINVLIENTPKLNISLKPNFGKLIINSTPEQEAEIYINNEKIEGTTPHTIDRYLSGTYAITLKKKMFEDITQEFTINDELTTKLDIIMKPQFAVVSITAKPEADIYIDNTKLGTGSYSKRLLSGTYNLELKKNMYHTQSQELQVTAGKDETLVFDLKPNFGGVTISSVPADAEITLDNKATGKNTPHTFEKIASGSHNVSLRKEMYEPVTQEFTIKDGESADLSIALKPIFGNIEITAKPEAEIYIDKQKAGTGTYKGRLISGIHTIEIKKDKYYTEKKTTDIKVGKTETLNFELKPITGVLSVNTIPIEAEIFIDGEPKGTTPKFIRDLQVGTYTVIFKKSSYADITKTIEIKEKETTEINETLLSAQQVTINSTPTSTKLYINGDYKGETPKSLSLSFSKHTVKLEKDGYIALEETFEVIQNKTSYEFELLSEKYGTFTDKRDGKTYKTVKIGNQIWMAENLNYKTSSGSWCYDDNSSNCDIYGRLYNWETAKTACPSADGWHLPTDDEWTTLVNYLGGEKVAGGKLKSTTSWTSPNTGASNSSGFSALPSGYRNTNGNYCYRSYGTNLWSSTECGTIAWNRTLNYSMTSVLRSNYGKANGFSVRCLKD